MPPTPIPDATDQLSPRQPGFAQGLIPNPEALFDSILDKEMEEVFYADNHLPVEHPEP
jgi:hypothetical protein